MAFHYHFRISIFYFNAINLNCIFFLLLSRASLLRPAPFELPQGGNAARVEGCSGAIKGACPFFFFN